MFSVQQKRDIADAVQKILRATNHPELPRETAHATGEVRFRLHVDGAESWSFADIENNGAVGDPGVNPHNELMDSLPPEEARGLLDVAKKITESPPRHQVEDYVPEEFLKEVLRTEIKQLRTRLNALVQSVEGFAQKGVDSDVRISKIETALGATADSDANALLSLPDRLSNLETAIRQLGKAT